MVSLKIWLKYLMLSALAASPVPSVSTGSSLISKIQALYPELSHEQLVSAFKGAPHPFKFLRSFVPFYYEEVKGFAPLEKSLIPLKNQMGWCVGDAHLENFGALLDGEGHSQFTMNDMDDSGPCPLLLDTLRFLTGVRLYDSSFELNPLLEAYKLGLSGKDRALSSEVNALLKDSAQAGRRIPKKNLSGDQKLFRKDEAEKVSESESLSVKTALSVVYQTPFEFLDIYKIRKKTGGSHGLLRYQVLVLFPASGIPKLKGQAEEKELTHLELKQISKPGIYPVAGKTLPSPEERIKKTLLIEQGDRYSRRYQVTTVDKIPYLIRPRWKGNIGVDLSNYGAGPIRKIAEDEMWTLGKIHKKTAPASYVAGVQKSLNSDWIKLTDKHTQKMTTAYKALKVELETQL